MRVLCAAGLAASVLACGSPMSRHPEASSGASSQTQSLTDYLNGQFEEELARQPEWATAMGRKDNYGKLDDRSEMATTDRAGMAASERTANEGAVRSFTVECRGSDLVRHVGDRTRRR